MEKRLAGHREVLDPFIEMHVAGTHVDVQVPFLAPIVHLLHRARRIERCEATQAGAAAAAGASVSGSRARAAACALRSSIARCGVPASAALPPIAMTTVAGSRSATRR